MTEKTNTTVTLSDEDMTTSRHLTRRSLLGSTRIAAGFGVAALLFGTLVLYFDIGHLRSLAAQSPDGLLTLALFFFGLVVTFGSVAMGVGVMSQGQDEN